MLLKMRRCLNWYTVINLPLYGSIPHGLTPMKIKSHTHSGEKLAKVRYKITILICKTMLNIGPYFQKEKKGGQSVV
jgi:hypothetical protein